MSRRITCVALLITLLSGCDGGPEPPPGAGASAGMHAAGRVLTAAPAASPAPAGPPSTALSTALPAEVDSLPSETGGVCSFDSVAAQGDRLHVVGWAATAPDGKPADRLFIRVSGPQGDRYAAAPAVRREDVARALDNPALADSGFEIWLDRSDVPRGTRITLYQVDGSRLRMCHIGASA